MEFDSDRMSEYPILAIEIQRTLQRTSSSYNRMQRKNGISEPKNVNMLGGFLLTRNSMICPKKT